MKTLFLIVTIFLLMSSVGVYAGAAAESGPLEVESPSTGPLIIGWSMNAGKVDAVIVTWTPAASGVYKIEAMSGNFYGAITTPVTTTAERTDVVPIDSIDAEKLDTVNVAIVEM